jgi:hypothetical protein
MCDCAKLKAESQVFLIINRLCMHPQVWSEQIPDGQLGIPLLLKDLKLNLLKKGVYLWTYIFKLIYYGFSGVFAEIGSSYVDPLHYLSSRSDFWLQFRGDIHHRKTIPWLGEPGSHWLWLGFWMMKRKLPSRRVSDSPTRRAGDLLWWVGESLFKFFKIYHHFKWLIQPFKRSIWQKRSQGWINVLSPLIYLKVWKKLYHRQSCRHPNSASLGVVFRLRISPQIWS